MIEESKLKTEAKN